MLESFGKSTQCFIFLSLVSLAAPKGDYDWSRPLFAGFEELRTSASNPFWGSTDVNLCVISKKRLLKATSVMGSDRAYADRTRRCIKEGWRNPVEQNKEYADAHGYGLRLYVDEDVPFLVAHRPNAMQGELRKIFALADSIRPAGPEFGTWLSVARHARPDLVMWVDFDAHIEGLGRRPIVGRGEEQPHLGDESVEPAVANRSSTALDLNEVTRRACRYAEYPADFVRFIANDAGNNVNAGLYIIAVGYFGSYFLKYILELFEIYGATGAWGQHIIQEALLVAMSGKPPSDWTIALPCSGEKSGILTNLTVRVLSKKCTAQPPPCVRAHATAWVNSTSSGKLVNSANILNGCFMKTKYELAPNAEDNWLRAEEAIATQEPGCSRFNGDCCDGYNRFASPACNGGSTHSGSYWAASGAGIVLLPTADEYVRLNSVKFKTNLLWHHGHGKLLRGDCT